MKSAVRTAFGLVFVAFAAALAADAPAVAPAIRTLDNGVLAVGVMDPASPQRYNRGMRFTPVAAVLSAVYEGGEYLFHPIEHDPVNDHGGLATEFDLCIPGGPADHLPSGYQEAAEGGGFLKIGVGALRKGKQPYNFFQNPEVVESAETTVDWRADSAVFHQTYAGTSTPGYAYVLEAVVALVKNQIAVDWKLTNTGTKPITTRQYTHNFFRIADHDTGPGYTLAFPYDFEARGLESGQRQEGRNIIFLEGIPKWINAVVPYPKDFAGPNTLTLRHEPSGRFIMCETSLPSLRTDIHARSGFISPEQFIEITLQPGESKTWKRSYTLGRKS